MKCDEFESRLQELLDDRLQPEGDVSLTQHAEECVACDQMLSAQQSLWQGLDAFEAPAMSTTFTDAVLANLEPPRVRQRRRDVILALAMIAALLLVALIPIVGIMRPQREAAILDKDGRDLDDPTVTVEPKSNPSFSANSTAAGAENKSAVQDATENWTLLNLSEVEIPEVSFDSDQIPGVRPLANSVNVAITLIRRTFAGGKDHVHSKPPATSRLDAALLFVA